jgi:hypothetical protein
MLSVWCSKVIDRHVSFVVLSYETARRSEKMQRAINRTILVLVFASATFTVCGQSGGTITADAALAGPYTPERGSSERKAILDALRLPVEKQLRQSVIFKIDHLKVQSGWAFIIGRPQQADGSAVDYSNTVYQEAIEEGAFDDSIVALLQNTGGKWRVKQFVIGATDVPWVDWDQKYRAPKRIFKLNTVN